MKVGDTLYKHIFLSGVAAYKCIAVTKRDKATHYELECQNCTHEGDSCVVLVRKSDYSKTAYKFMDCINCEEGCSDDNHRHAHETSKDHLRYFTTRREALMSCYQHSINLAKEDVKKAKEILELQRKRVTEWETHYENVKDGDEIIENETEVKDD